MALTKHLLPKLCAFIVPTASRCFSTRLFTAYKLYKGQTAMNMAPIPPKIQAHNNAYVLNKPGSICIDLAKNVIVNVCDCVNPSAPAIANAKTYDWKNKQSFILSLAEIGVILTGRAHIQIKREAFKSRFNTANPDAPSVRRVFTLASVPVKQEWSLMLQSQPANGDVNQWNSLELLMTDGDYEIMKRLLSTSVPKLLAWEMGWDPQMEAASSDSVPMVQEWPADKQ